MNITKPASTKHEDFFTADKVEISTIPPDFSIQVNAGSLCILGVTRHINGTLHKDGVIFPNVRFADIVELYPNEKFIILRL